jgi:regulator of sigma E protease
MLINIFAVLLVLGTLVIVHEFGHYAAAKFFGVRVEVFSVGFGKRLFGFRRGDTDYRVSLLPLGGYVKMSGENPMETPTGDPGEFMSHPRWQRFIIAVAGPFMNIALAIVLLTGVFMVHYAHPYFLDQLAVIGWVGENSPAAKSGLQPGDRIAQVEDVKDPVWEQVLLRELMAGGQPLELRVQRDSKNFAVTVTPNAVGEDRHGVAGWEPAVPPIVADVEKGKPAEQAGIKAGDQILAFNGTPLHSMTVLQHLVQKNKDNPAEVVVRRDGTELTFKLSPVLVNDGGEQYYRIGVAHPRHVDKLSFSEAFNKSIQQNKQYAGMILLMVKKLVQQKVSIKQISGPVGIGQAAGDAFREQGWLPLIYLTALISINLGIFNLFPIPILDGGLILLLLIEGVMRRDINREIKERVYQAAFVFLIIFAVVVIYNDISKLPGIGRLLP